jgi:hypothetical protein
MARTGSGSQYDSVRRRLTCRGNQTRVSIAARAARCGQRHTRRFPTRRPAWNTIALCT